jgi:hypothetical protein
VVAAHLGLEAEPGEVLAVGVAVNLPGGEEAERVDQGVVGVDAAAGGLVDRRVFQGPGDAVLF